TCDRRVHTRAGNTGSGDALRDDGGDGMRVEKTYDTPSRIPRSMCFRDAKSLRPSWLTPGCGGAGPSPLRLANARLPGVRDGVSWGWAFHRDPVHRNDGIGLAQDETGVMTDPTPTLTANSATPEKPAEQTQKRLPGGVVRALSMVAALVAV